MEHGLLLEILRAVYFENDTLRDRLLLVLIEKETCSEIFLFLQTLDQELTLCQLSHDFRVSSSTLISGGNFERWDPYVDMSGAWPIILIVEQVSG